MAGLNFNLCPLLSSKRRRSAAFLTPGSVDRKSCAIRDTCCLLYKPTKDGIANPPFFTGRKRTDTFDGLARPAHFFRALVASGCRSFSSQEMGKSSTIRGYDSLEQTPNLNKRNFCCRVRGTSSMEASICCKFCLRDSLAELLFL